MNLLFFKFILWFHLLLGLIFSDCDSQCFKSHENSLLRKYAHDSVTHPQGTSTVWEAIGHHTWFPAPSQEKNGFAAGPASCLSTHKGILENSGISDSTRHPCVGNWVELFITVSPLPCQCELKQLRNALDVVRGGGKLNPSALLHT